MVLVRSGDLVRRGFYTTPPHHPDDGCPSLGEAFEATCEKECPEGDHVCVSFGGWIVDFFLKKM